jgi:hypothetical protein
MKHPIDFRDTQGSIAVVTALSLTVLTGAAGMATIYVQSQSAKASIQASLDAAVLAGTALRTGTPDAQRIKAAKRAFEFNLQQATKGSSAEIEITKDTEFLINETQVTGMAHARVKNTLGAALGITSMQVDTAAVAKKMESDPLCILTLDKTQPSTIEIYGNAHLNARDCAVQTNSNSGEGMKIYGNQSSATASQFGVTGDYSGDNWSPKPVTGTEPVLDPYADLPVSEPGACVAAGSIPNSGAFTLNPGTYCGGLDLKAGVTVTLNPGIYIMKDGQFAVNSGATVTGEDVLIALVGVNSFLDLKSGSAVRLTSPREGVYKNMQFMSDRDVSHSKFEQEWTTIFSGATLDYDGVMYLPEQQFWVSGTGHDVIISANSPSLAMVVNKLWAQGNVVLEITQEDRRGIGKVAQAPGFGFGAMLAK